MQRNQPSAKQRAFTRFGFSGDEVAAGQLYSLPPPPTPQRPYLSPFPLCLSTVPLSRSRNSQCAGLRRSLFLPLRSLSATADALTFLVAPSLSLEPPRRKLSSIHPPSRVLPALCSWCSHSRTPADVVLSRPRSRGSSAYFDLARSSKEQQGAARSSKEQSRSKLRDWRRLELVNELIYLLSSYDLFYKTVY
jgi:hypothetical protein